METYNQTELTEIRKQIFPRYIGIDFKVSVGYTEKLHGFTKSFVEQNEYLCLFDLEGNEIEEYAYECKPLLKLLSSITDEDAIEVAKIGKCKYCIADVKDLKPHLLRALNNSSQWNGKTWIAIYQYLQLKGYALPHLVLIDGKPVTLSVEDQIKYGIIELK